MTRIRQVSDHRHIRTGDFSVRAGRANARKSADQADHGTDGYRPEGEARPSASPDRSLSRLAQITAKLSV